MKNVNDLEMMVASGELRQLHTAKTNGYVSRKTGPVVRPYKGKFGIGYVSLSPSWESTRFCYVTYYVR